MENGNEEILEEFVMESRESLDNVEPMLIEMEDSADDETLDAIFRLFHSMKGTAAFIDLAQMAALTQVAESLLDLIRKGKVQLSRRHVDLFCEAVDLSRVMLDTVEKASKDHGHEEDVERVKARLQQAVDE